MSLVFALAVLAVVATTAQASKFYDSNFGTSMTGVTLGGTFGTTNGGIGDIAVNDPSITSDGTGQSGWIYVVDRGNNRIQAFDANKNFQWAIGRDVVASAVNEQQTVTVTATGGTFTLTFDGQTTGPLAWNASTATVQTALRGLSSVGAPGNTNVTVSNGVGSATGGTPYVVTFGGILAAANQPQLTSNASALTHSTAGTTPSAAVATLANGSATTTGDQGVAFEKCTVAQDCKTGTTGSLGGELNIAQGIDVDQATGHFFVSERTNNRRVQEFTADGTFVRAFGWDVVQPGGTGENLLAPVSEQQRIALSAVFPPFQPSSTFMLTFDGQTTTAIAHDASAAALDAALEALSTIGAGNVEVGGSAGGPWTVDFTGALANTDVATMTSNNAALLDSLGIPGTASITTPRPGGAQPGFETCTIAAQCQAASLGAGGVNPGQFGSSSQTINGLAVAPAGAPNAGRVYVADPANTRVLAFTVPANPTGPVVPGAPIGSSAQFLSNYPREVATDAQGVVYATSILGSNGGYVNRYDTTTGEFLARLAATDGNQILGSGPVLGLEVDHSTDNLLVGRPAAFGVREFDLSAKPDGLDSSLHVDSHGEGLFGSATTGTPPSNAFGVGGGRIFVSTSVAAVGTGSGQRVAVLDDTGIDPPPTVALQPPTDVGSTTATFNASINPNATTGFATFYRFELSKDGIDWVPVGSDVSVGDGATAVQVADQATGLEANTLYRIRIRTNRKPAAGTAFSAELTFLTDAAQPTAQTNPAQNISDTTAQLVGTLNPNGLATSYWFEWGDNDYGNTIPAPSATATGSTDRLVAETLTGLSPDATYHFRLCAQNSLAATPICGADEVFATRTAASASARRAFEMVSSPDKVLRRGGQNAAADLDYTKFAEALPAASGDALQWGVFAGPVDPGAGTGFARDVNPELRRRGPDGWQGEAVFNQPMAAGASATVSEPIAFSADLETQFWAATPSVFDPDSGLAMRVFDNTGGPVGAGWYPFNGTPNYIVGSVRMTGDGAQLLAAGSPGAIGDPGYRNMDPAEGLPASELSPPQTAGNALLVGRSPTWAPADLVSECTGVVGSDATTLPSRVGSGVATDTIGERQCGVGSPTDVRGSDIAIQDGPLTGVSSMVMSDDGKRVFFSSPGALGAGGGPCEGSTGAGTACPSQLLVRQYDDQGGATVRWISRAEDALAEAPQLIGAFGNGVAFEGASQDGSVVYFRTNAPLLADDPNGGEDPLAVASSKSWDLYRYELGADNNTDPAAGDPGDRLTRISGGPDGDADPNTNCTSVATDCGFGTSTPLDGSVVRFMSDDGQRVYFVTAAQIPGARNAPPVGGATTPSAVDAQVNATDRNLYLHDPDKAGADAYEFVARIPWSTANGFEACLSSGTVAAGPQLAASTTGWIKQRPAGNCVHGSSSGDSIVFTSVARLTTDDVDDAADVYLYDASADRLERLSAPSPDASPYTCLTMPDDVAPLSRCNGDLGMSASSFSTLGANAGGTYGFDGLRSWNVSEDAVGDLRCVYFESRLALAEDAAANDRMKVYEWCRSGGRLSLVSPPDSSVSAFYTGNSRDGDDVFFWTEQRISGWEIDDADGDIYNATTRPDPIPEPGPDGPEVCAVLAGGCQGGDGPVLAPSTPTSGTGGGNTTAGQRTVLTVASLGAKARRRAVRTGVIALRVRTSGPGRVSVAARAKIGGRSRLVAKASARRAGAGVVMVRAKLSSRARRALHSGRRLAVAVRVSMPGARTRAMTVRLARPRS